MAMLSAEAEMEASKAEEAAADKRGDARKGAAARSLSGPAGASADDSATFHRPVLTIADRVEAAADAFVGEEWAAMKASPATTSADSPRSLRGVQMLARSGVWMGVAKLAGSLAGKLAERLSDDSSCRRYLAYRLWQLSALVVLQREEEARDILDSMGSLTDSAFLYKAEDGQRSYVPFQLHLLAAELPHRLGQAATTYTALHQLESVVKAYIDSDGQADSLPAAAGAMLRGVPVSSACQLLKRVQLSILSLNIGDRNFALALKQCEALVTAALTEEKEGHAAAAGGDAAAAAEAEAGEDGAEAADGGKASESDARSTSADTGVLMQLLPTGDGGAAELSATNLLVKLTLIYLEMGHVTAAETLTRMVEGRYAAPDASPTVICLRGLLLFCKGQHMDAMSSFESILNFDWPSAPAGDAVFKRKLCSIAASNTAICALHCCMHKRAVAVLEEHVKADPVSNLTHNVVYNLCTLYDLACDAAQSERHKRVIQYLATHFGHSYMLPTSFRL
eukprot:PLAT12767.2.p1 GENE.PLAT12767.2~~PLAT12767.2.p1  ORF type:complete len:508 (-),score=205.53 PLAT12767.2:56-1579(-)